tara:strand:- start:175 stop:864 length:690 start_codon:yes stop_codon:yes gene_type:complete
MIIIEKTVRKIKKNIIKHKHRHIKTKINWDWGNKGFSRIALVNFLISKTGGISSKYLEIGCDNNVLFDAVMSMNKVGVDPVSGGTERMTSDEFFKINNKLFDVMFIDGLHHYHQVHKDTINGLKALNKDGWMAFHDFLPSCWEEQHVPRIRGVWTGDCWKLAYQLTKSKGIDFKILEIDHGVGLIRKTSDNWEIPAFSKELQETGFDEFLRIKKELPIFSYEEVIKNIS